MSAHVLLNLLNKSRKRDKMLGLLSSLPLFRKKFKKFNTGAPKLDTTVFIMWHKNYYEMYLQA